MIKTRKVGDISVNELKDIIKETFYEIIDPDHDLQLSPEVKKELCESLKSKERLVTIHKTGHRRDIYK